MAKDQKRSEQELETENYLLEPILPRHAGELFEPLQAPELYEFIPGVAPKSVADLERRFTAWARRGSEDGREIWLNWAIKDARSGEYVGTLQATVQKEGATYIAYAVFPACWGRGIARETGGKMIEELFAYYNVATVSALVDTRNARSQRLLEALGFSRKETILAADEFKGSISNEFLYELSRPR